MKKDIKKAIRSFIVYTLVLCLLLTNTNVGSIAAEITDGNEQTTSDINQGDTAEIIEGNNGIYKYQICNNNVEILEYLSSEDNVVIPEKIEDKPVIKIGKQVFSGKTITDITIEAKLTEIGYAAFLNRNNLSSVELPSTLENIEGKASEG